MFAALLNETEAKEEGEEQTKDVESSSMLQGGHAETASIANPRDGPCVANSATGAHTIRFRHDVDESLARSLPHVILEVDAKTIDSKTGDWFDILMWMHVFMSRDSDSRTFCGVPVEISLDAGTLPLITDDILRAWLTLVKAQPSQYPVSLLELRRHQITDGAAVAELAYQLRPKTVALCGNPLGTEGLLNFARADLANAQSPVKTLFAFYTCSREKRRSDRLAEAAHLLLSGGKEGLGLGKNYLDDAFLHALARQREITYPRLQTLWLTTNTTSVEDVGFSRASLADLAMVLNRAPLLQHLFLSGNQLLSQEDLVSLNFPGIVTL